MNVEYKFIIRGETEMNGKKAFIHPENIQSFFKISNYHTQLTPMYLIKLTIDKGLMNYIISNVETIQIRLIVEKFERSVGTGERIGPVTPVYDMRMAPLPGNDVNYMHILDQLDPTMKEQAYRSDTYLGLVNLDALDKNKFVENCTLLNSMVQDYIMTMLDQKGCHLLIEPFTVNDHIDQLVIPAMDSTYSVIQYFNNMKSFYSTKPLFFFDEPNVTYLISKSGQGTEMIGELYNTVVLHMRNALDINNVALGMDSSNGQYYAIDIPTTNGTYKIDTETNKLYDTISAIINPSVDHNKMMNDIFTKIKEQFKEMISGFVKDIASKCNVAGEMTHVMSMIPNTMDHAVNEIKRVTSSLETEVHGKVNEIIANLPLSITSKDDAGIETIIPLFTNQRKSILKSTMDNKFISCADNLDLQGIVKSEFSKIVAQSAGALYNSYFADLHIGAITAINLQDVAKATDNLIKGVKDTATAAIKEMAKEVTSRMSSFPNLENMLGSMKDVMGDIGAVFEPFITIDEDGNIILKPDNTGNDSSPSSDLDINLIHDIFDTKGIFAHMEQKTKYYTEGFANKAYEKSGDAQSITKGFADKLNSYVGKFTESIKKDMKGEIVSKEPARIFGDLDLSTFTVGGGFGGGFNKDSGNPLGGMLGGIANLDFNKLVDKVSGGIVSLLDVSKLSKSLEKFNLNNIGELGMSFLNFDLNLGGDKKGSIGTKLLKVKNDNPNFLKVIKSELETNRNIVKLHKENIDPTVITPNKVFIVKNLAGRENKDGQFILKSKIEMYAREDNTFNCTTQMTLAKIVSQGSANGEENAELISKQDPNSNNDNN